MTTESKESKIKLGAVQPPEVVIKKRGPGRPPKTKTQRIRDMIAAGASVKYITEKSGVSPQQVYQARYDLRQKELVSKQWAEPKLLPMPDDRAPCTPKEAAFLRLRPPPAPKPTFWQRVKAVFFPN
jgi:hypothetical protein